MKGLFTLAPCTLCHEQSKFAAGVACNSSVFLRSSEEIRKHKFYFAVRQILGDVKAKFGKVVTDVVAHAIKLREVKMWVVERQVFFLNKPCKFEVALFVVRA